MPVEILADFIILETVYSVVLVAILMAYLKPRASSESDEEDSFFNFLILKTNYPVFFFENYVNLAMLFFYFSMVNWLFMQVAL